MINFVTRTLYRPLIYSVALSLPIVAQDEPANQAVEQKLTISSAIQQLADEDYDRREEATKFLWANATVAELKDLTTDENPEVRIRAQRLVQTILTGLTPDTPPDIVTLVNSFAKASPEDKARIIQKLISKSAYIPAFTLSNQLDPDLALHKEVQNQVKELPPNAVKHYLEEEKPELALRVTDIVEPSSTNSRLWAFVHMIQGTAKSALAQLLAKDPQDEHSKSRVLALYRSMAETDDAIAWAEKYQQQDYLAGQALFANDLTAFISWWKEQNPKSKVLPEYLDAIMLRSKGKITEAKELEKGIIDNSKRGRNASAHSTLQLSAFGNSSAAYDLLPTASKIELSGYLTNKADFKSFCKLYGLEYGKPITKNGLRKT